jgi:hypothetical protein
MFIIAVLPIAIFVFIWAIRLECDYRIKEETSFNEHDLYLIKLKLEELCPLAHVDDMISSNLFQTAITFYTVPYIYIKEDDDFKILIYKKYCKTYKEFYQFQQKHKLWRYDVFYKNLKLRTYYNFKSMVDHLEDLYKKRTRYYKKAQIKNIALQEHIHDSSGI